MIVQMHQPKCGLWTRVTRTDLKRHIGLSADLGKKTVDLVKLFIRLRPEFPGAPIRLNTRYSCHNHVAKFLLHKVEINRVIMVYRQQQSAPYSLPGFSCQWIHEDNLNIL
jgi:hypothetical protein